MKRRSFLQNGLYGSILLVVAPRFMSSCSSDDDETPDNGKETTIDLTNSAYAALNSSGGYAYTGNIIVINTGTSFIALTKICTHEGCTVAFQASSENLVCPCHGSVFSKSGAVLQGPASSSLRLYTVTQSGNILTIK